MTALIQFSFLSLCILLSIVVLARRRIPYSSDDIRSPGAEERFLASTTFITIVLKLDDFPTETSWTLRKASDNSIVDSRQEGFYNQPNKYIVHNINVIQGAAYDFTLNDAYGDGMGARGYFELYYGAANIFQSSPNDLIIRMTSFIGFEQHVNFTARLPTSTAAPTPAPLSPTPAPTNCVETLNYEVQSYPFTQDPVYTSARFEFGISEAICASRTNYADCTNEDREDCQWIFLTQGNRNGKCRVDPIAKCLETGDCVCSTTDFHGGDANGILFHVPISITARDISPNNKGLSYFETYDIPSFQDPKHPQDDAFFISKVDFTGRQLNYVFNSTNPTITTATKSVFFKLHYLYTDVPLKGTIWVGLGLTVTIDTSTKDQTIGINGRRYILPKKLRIWTCTQIAITPTTLYVAGIAIPRLLAKETSVPPPGLSLRLGSFSGELFDVRVYSGVASRNQVHEVGARCAGPNDFATIKKYEDIETLYLQRSCQELHPLMYGRAPTDGMQTYGSGVFATLWMRPIEDPLNPGNYLNIPAGYFDKEYFFQQAKLQSYQWERNYFEDDMIGFVLEPYRMFTTDEMRDWWSKSTFNNPCQYIHQNNNNWDFPLYNEGVVPKWTVHYYSKYYGGSSDAVFDLGMLYRNGGFDGYGYFTHKAFHGFHVNLVETYDAQPSGWMQESSAELTPALLFPGGRRIMAGFVMAPAWPLSFSCENTPANAHIFSTKLSLSDGIRGGHYYGSWMLCWFLSQHAGLPHLLGQMFSVDRHIVAYWLGKKLFMLQLLLRSHDIDLGNAYAIFIAHLRTWDFKNGAVLKEMEQLDFLGTGFEATTTLEERKTAAIIDPNMGTNGAYVSGPDDLRSSLFSWNCLTGSEVAAGKVLGISMSWADGMGFASSDATPPQVVEQHAGCDSDIRFYNSMVVLHNEATGERCYWKVQGKDPATLYVDTGNGGPVTLHVLLPPTPPADYSGGRNLELKKLVLPLPVYSYEYKIDFLDSVPTGEAVSAAAEKEFCIVKFNRSSDLAWFSSKCSYLDDPDHRFSRILCVRPVFKDATPIPEPSPTRPPTLAQTILPTEPIDTQSRSRAPTRAPTTRTATKKLSTRSRKSLRRDLLHVHRLGPQRKNLQ